MAGSFEWRQQTRQQQSQTLAPQMREALRFLQMPAMSLANEIRLEIDRNPVLENGEDATPSLTDAEHEAKERDDVRMEELPEDEAAPSVSADEDAIERRERLFDLTVRPETLEDHLLAQVPLSDIPTAQRGLAETLIGQINDDGRFKGSLADIEMVTGADEKTVNALLRRILKFDPTGCGARDLRECLLAQLDKLDGHPRQGLVRRIVAHHLEDIAEGRAKAVAATLGVDAPTLAGALTALRTLDPKPGRAFASATLRPEYVSPEIQAVCEAGRWTAVVDERDLPEIRISPRYRRMLEEGREKPEVLAYVRERIQAAEAFRLAVIRRQDTIRNIAQTVFDAQPGFFERGFSGLHPLTMATVAEKVGVDISTVSRTVNGKYVTTPHGTFELRKFFAGGVTTESGETVTTDAVKRRLREIVSAEDAAHPLSDEALAAALVKEGLDIKRRTVAKYRAALGIPGTAERRKRK